MKILKVVSIMSIVLIISCKDNKSSMVIKEKANPKAAINMDSLKEAMYPSLWVYGMISPKDNINWIVARWYGFNFDIKGGCTTPQDIGKEEHNRKTDSILSARIGKDWEQRFDKSVDSLYSLDTLAVGIAKSDKCVIGLDTVTEKYGKYDTRSLEFRSHPTEDDNIKLVTVDSQLESNKKRYRWMHYMTITVDLEKKKVIKVDMTSYGTI
jgi:hypothetical protein